MRCPADALRVHHPVGARAQQLLLAVVATGPSDDEQVRPQRAGTEDDEGVVGIPVHRGHERGGALDARRHQHGVLGGIADHDVVRLTGHPLRIEVTTTYRRLAASTSAAMARPTRPHPQMIT